MKFLYSKEVKIPEEVREFYLDYNGIEIALGGIDESFFKEHANGTVIINLVPKKNGKPYQVLAMLSRLHEPDIESLTQYVDALAGNERFLIDTLAKRVVERKPELIGDSFEV